MGIIFHGLRLQKIQQMEASQYPHIPVEQFERWKRLEIMSIYVFLLAMGFIVAAIGIFRIFMPPEHSHVSVQQGDLSVLLTLCGGGVLACMISLVVAAIMGSMAASLRKKYNITLNVLNDIKNGISTLPQSTFPQNTFPQNMPPPAPAPYRAPTGPVYRSKTSAFSSIDWPNAGPSIIAIIVVIALVVMGLIYLTRRSSVTNSYPPMEHNTEASIPRQTQDFPIARSYKRVMALYYPWYQTKSYSHRWAHQSGIESQHRRMATHTHYPVQGPYDSADPAVTDRQLKQAEEAGIDTLVCSWWGPKDPTDKALRLLLMRAVKTQIKICVLWERLTPPATADTPESDLAYIVQTFGTQPAYLSLNNKPVVFAYEGVSRQIHSVNWSQFRKAFDTRFAPGVFLLGVGLDPLDAALWDAQYTLGEDFRTRGTSPEDLARAHEQEYAQSLRQVDRISVVTVEPGYDDRKPSAALGLRARKFIARQNGKVYSALWQQALREDPDWILVNSFNQWHVGTEIEPSVELGDTYLKLTGKFARRFKQKSGPVPASKLASP